MIWLTCRTDFTVDPKDVQLGSVVMVRVSAIVSLKVAFDGRGCYVPGITQVIAMGESGPCYVQGNPDDVAVTLREE